MIAKEHTEGRRSDRLKVILSATVLDEASRMPVRIIDLSRDGALIIGDLLPAPKSKITLRCGSQSVSGTVAWRKGKRAGLRFDRQVNRQRFGRKCNRNIAIVRDTRKPDFRRPGFRGTQLTAEEQAFMAQLISNQQVQLA